MSELLRCITKTSEHNLIRELASKGKLVESLLIQLGFGYALIDSQHKDIAHHDDFRDTPKPAIYTPYGSNWSFDCYLPSESRTPNNRTSNNPTDGNILVLEHNNNSKPSPMRVNTTPRVYVHPLPNDSIPSKSVGQGPGGHSAPPVYEGLGYPHYYTRRIKRKGELETSDNPGNEVSLNPGMGSTPRPENALGTSNNTHSFNGYVLEWGTYTAPNCLYRHGPPNSPRPSSNSSRPPRTPSIGSSHYLSNVYQPQSTAARFQTHGSKRARSQSPS